jgi:polyhydroxyalkanoate synthesis regulator phasin
MDEQLTALAKEAHDLRDRQLQDRHEAMMRDDAIFRRMSIHEERMDFHSEALKKTIAAVGECADTITRLGQRIDALVTRMDKTDERWNQLIEQLTREHRNGGKKR